MLELSFATPNRFGPSRSAVMGTRGMVVTSQPVAAWVGIDILRQGGNAIDAAVATAAMLNVIEPMSTGIGGDAFGLIYEAETKTILGLNGSGRSPHAASLEEYRRRVASENVAGDQEIPSNSMLAVTVPGVVDGWATVLERCGRMGFRDVLAPAIAAAEDGFAVAPHTSRSWEMFGGALARFPDSAKTWFHPDGRAPRPGELFRNPNLARTLRMIAEGGREAFYRGNLADAIIKFSEANGGFFTRDDFADHTSTWIEPLSIGYRGYDILELPPNGQGIAVLEALHILSQEDLASRGYGTVDTAHLQIEALKMSLHDAKQHVTDPAKDDVPIDRLLSLEHAKQQHGRIDLGRAIDPLGATGASGDTVYLCVADADGNIVSFINSIFHPWGSGLTVGDTGIVLQNRGSSFSLDPDHPNVIASHKRTRHTILPAMLLYEGSPVVAFGCVGGDVQPQGQLQFLCNVIDFGMNLQDALDAPRWRYDGGRNIALESGVPADLADRGHAVGASVGFFGGGQALLAHPEYGTFQGGSDSRRDGCAIGF